jgi:hypothetical protein
MAATGVLLVALVLLPWLVLRQHLATSSPRRHEGFGSLEFAVWGAVIVFATLLALVSLALLWWRRPGQRSHPLRLAVAAGWVPAMLVLFLLITVLSQPGTS